MNACQGVIGRHNLLAAVLSGCLTLNAAERLVSPGGIDAGDAITNPCASIQYAVDVAEAGDVIKVSSGTYSGSQDRSNRWGVLTRQVVHIDKGVILRGGFPPGDWATNDPIAYPSVIHALGDGRPVSVVNAGPEPVVVDGFTLTGGDYTGLGNPPGVANQACARNGGDCGGGLFVQGSSLHLLNCSIQGNVAGTNSFSDGGGVYLWDVRDILIEDTIIAGNLGPGFGGGLYVHYQLSPCHIRNTILATNSAGAGGGIALSANIEAPVVIEDSLLVANRAQSGGGGALYANLVADGLNLSINRVKMQDNSALEPGKAIVLNSAGPRAPTAHFANLLLTRNSSEPGAPDDDTESLIALGQGFTSLSVFFSQITAADNPVSTFLLADAGWYDNAILVGLENTLLVGFDTAFAAQDVPGQNTVQVAHTNTLAHNVTNLHHSLGGAPVFVSINPLSGDPMLDADYRPQVGSAAVDVVDFGHAEDMDRLPRPLDGDAVQHWPMWWLSGWDIGAYEFVNDAGDVDSDLLSDQTELTVTHTNPQKPDTDLDGHTDYQEAIIAGTDPLDAEDVLRIISIARSNQSVQLTWDSKTGHVYSLLGRSVLADPGLWQPLAPWTNLTATSSSITATNLEPFDQQWYRVEVNAPAQ